MVQWVSASSAGVEGSVPCLGTKIPRLGTMTPCDLQHDQKSTTTIIKYTPCMSARSKDHIIHFSGTSSEHTM